MEIIHINNDQYQEGEVVLACGLFDGVHQGHVKVLESAREYAKKNKLKFGVLTFSVSPKNIFNNKKQFLMTLSQRVKKFKQHGADVVLVFDTNAASLKVSGLEFVNLLKQNNVVKTFSGTDFRFGNKAINDWSDIPALSSETIQSTALDFVEYNKDKISTTNIIDFIREGKMKDATECLGHNYEIIGTVMEGNKLGRTIGFPTANIHVEDGYVIPKKGVYKTKTVIGDKAYDSITNIGNNPTVDNNEFIKAETHIFDFHGDLYGKQINIDFIDFIRAEKKFNGINELKEQIKLDIIEAKK